ncbi:MAG: diguanylate cyclase [Spirochaetota bacterium]
MVNDRTPEFFQRYGIAHATIRIARDPGGEVRAAALTGCNSAFAEQTGLSPEVGEAFLHEGFGAGATTALAEYTDAASSESSTFPQFFRSSSRWFSCYTSSEGPNEISAVFVDITDYRADSALMQIREQAYRSFIEHLQMIAFLRVVWPDPMSLFIAGSFREITGYGPELGASTEGWLSIVHPDDREMVESEARRLHTEPEYDGGIEYRIIRKDGRTRWVHSYDRQFTSVDGSMQLIQGLIMDVTNRRRQEEDLRRANERIQEQNRLLARLARTDPLTGLLNRRAMQEQLERELRLYDRGRGTFSVLLIDLDEFKHVNDVYGHRAGDRVLVHVAEALGEHLRKSDVYARWGGEEFMILFSGTNADSSFPVAQKLLSVFATEPTTFDDTSVSMTFTGGLTEACEGDTVDSLFARADRALYKGKSSGRNRIIRL